MIPFAPKFMKPFGGGAVGDLDPLANLSIILRLRASLGVYQDAAATIPATPADNVRGWLDEQNAITYQRPAGLAPTLQTGTDGAPVIRFTIGEDVFDEKSFGSFSGLAMRFRAISHARPRRLCGASNDRLIRQGESNFLEGPYSGYAASSYGGVGAATSLVLWQDGSNNRLLINGVETGPWSFGGIWSKLEIGGQPANASRAAFDLAEIIAFTDFADRSAIADYLDNVPT